MFSIATELGGVLKARDRMGSQTNRPPSSHILFSRLEFTRSSGSTHAQRLEASDPGDDVLQDYGDGDIFGGGKMGGEITVGGWLESDDIDEF
jgi:cell cycle checkpoint protein